jgi:hypothetical protein
MHDLPTIKLFEIKKKSSIFWERETCLNQPKVFSGFLDEKMWSNQKEKII